ncbi:MAG: hypothetical protein M1133_13825 [Armatimonadetes bacterium]|nr:hypothetical protein [Armatimonadota bacterium]
MARTLLAAAALVACLLATPSASAGLDMDWCVGLRATCSGGHALKDLFVGTAWNAADIWRISPENDGDHGDIEQGKAEIGSKVWDNSAPHERASSDRRAPITSFDTRVHPKIWDLYAKINGEVPGTITITGWVYTKLDGADIAIELWKAEDYGVAGRTPLWTMVPGVTGSSVSPNFTSAPLDYSGVDIPLKLVAYAASAPRPCTVGSAKSEWVGQAVYIADAVVTSANADHAGLWVESGDRASGLKVDASWTVARGDKVEVTGVVSWIDGVPILTIPELKKQNGVKGIVPPLLTGAALACDLTESLAYAGLNPVGLLVTCCGRVTGVDATSRAFYIDDGSGRADGMSPYTGLRVSYSPGITPPGEHTMQRVTGIRTVEKVMLAGQAMVNGVLRPAGTTLYLPVVAIRDAGDVIPLN